MMSKTVIPHGYKPLLDLYQTQTAIGCLKRNFEQKLCAALNLKRVSAPLFVEPSTGLNDDLNGVERPVSFDLKETGRTAQVVHSLAKWKRMALYKYGFTAGEGLYTDMNAIRRDEEMDNLHSVYVDQWDWEKVITPAERTTAYLQSTVRAIYAAVSGTLDELKALYPQLTLMLPAEVGFITTQELEDLYPALPPKARENAYLKTHKATAARPTMTTGRLTATCCSGTTCSAVRSRCPLWASAWTVGRWTRSSPKRAATTAGR